ncbi:Pc22g03170 [Penicillium rubens Wisconsin 54-1255]|uniref:Pc22g03170 protein n=1 Tax=Penicillium rubens (strain ATCC 28089 / DSM 1075 / NRRL 1951 / Wisconsin 54-1255) TaxID=500485 RepID=B6HRA6_PENRW|nr:Pc22g03170 [Penicillium rubens Wisconsin 54-1255]
MQSIKVPDFLDTGAASRSRSPSVVSTDSQFSRVNLMSPPSVTPSPAFISPSAASEIISADQEFNAADFVAEDEETGAGATALVTPAALSLLNGFLDNLLFNILASSKSTQLACIRPAMAEVLKPRLAKEVVASAEEELSEYMGGADDEQTEFRGGQEPGGDFDLVRSWKLTRLRCMVYTRLGDMEEDDEDEFIAQDRLGETDGAPRRFTSHVDNITPAASIFLTSIIEYIGERALVIAGETSRSRLSAQLNNGGDELNGSGERKRIDRLVVEDLDMEKLALNATLGRLWRTWRQRRRGTTLSRTLSRESFRPRGYSLANSRKSSIVTIEEPVTPKEPLPVANSPPFDPATVPLPMSDYDVQEIEVPGYIGDLDGEVQTMQAVIAHKVRPRSLMVFSSPSLVPKSPGSVNSSPVSASAIEPGKSFRHVRTRSLPNEAATLNSAEEEPESPTDHPSPTASEKKQLETMYEDDESAEYVDAAETTTPGIAVTTEHEKTPAEASENARMSILHEEEEDTPPVSETVASLRAIAQDEDAMTDQSNSARVSIVSLGDRPNQKDPEVIEGTGLCEKPKLTSTPLTQGVETTPAPPAPPIEAVTSSIDHDATDDLNNMATTATPPAQPSEAHTETAKSSKSLPVDITRPTSSSGNSQRSKTRPRPAPLEVTASNRGSPASASASAVERAAVQRMSRPSTSTASSIITKTRRSGSFGSARENTRPVTAGSTTSHVSSKLKGLMGRPLGESGSPRMRSSSETSRASGSVDSVDDDIADLDKLINSDETIHYTLTPRSVREMTLPDMPSRSVPRSETAGVSDLAEFLNTTAPPDEEKHRPQASVSSKATGEMTPISHTRSIESPKHIPLTTRLTNMSSTSRSSKVGQARDARISPSESTRDFAEFMRSTGPASGPNESKTSISAESTRPIRPPSTLSTASRGNRPKLQARSAETGGSQTSDLIDFIREGPPMPAGAHRIPRTVAPFRNTIDSDDLHLDNTTSNSFVSTVNGSTPNKSLTSLGSRSGLLDSNRTKATASGSATDFDEPQPVRKQRRAPDPYAIDDDDDDALLEELLEKEQNPKPKREEESLMDFLRNAPPPPSSEQTPQPFAISAPASNGLSGASGMKARLLRTSQNSLRTQNAPTKVQSNYSAKVGQERNTGTMPSISNRQTDTGDLADFLRNTGPTPAPNRSSPMGSKAKDGGFSRFFARRKKVEA